MLTRSVTLESSRVLFLVIVMYILNKYARSKADNSICNIETRNKTKITDLLTRTRIELNELDTCFGGEMEKKP